MTLSLPTHIVVWKDCGETPLQAVGRLRRALPIPETIKLGYAGRLDPMAEGLLLVLVGEENTKKKHYENLLKTYVVEIIFDIATDSADVLGLVTKTCQNTIHPHTIRSYNVQTLIGRHVLPYPLYSAKRVAGHPLFYWARRGGLPRGTSHPTHTLTIYSITAGHPQVVASEEIIDKVLEIIPRLPGDLRQQEIVTAWNKWYETHGARSFSSLTITVEVSAGSYMRALTEEIARRLGTVGCAYSIIRTKLGPYSKSDCLRLP